MVVFPTLPAGSPDALMLSNRRVYDKLAPGLAWSPRVAQMAVPSPVTVALLPLLLAVVVMKSAPSMCTADGQVGHADPEHAVESTRVGGAVGMAAELAKKPSSSSIPQPYINLIAGVHNCGLLMPPRLEAGRPQLLASVVFSLPVARPA